MTVAQEFRKDGYINLLNKYGTTQDNSTGYIETGEALVPDQMLSQQYETNGLFAKIIDLPAEEAVKHGFELNLNNPDMQKYYDDIFDELGWEENVATAIKWARLFGGAIIVMLINDGRGLEEPLNVRGIKGIDELMVFERPLVQVDYSTMYVIRSRDGVKERRNNYKTPELYNVTSMYGSFQVHRDRCLIFRNGILPEFTTQPFYRHWGVPEFVRIRKELRQAITSHSYGVKMLERSVQAIYSMKDLARLLQTEEGEEQVLKRLQVIDMARGVLNSIAIDSDGENYDFRNMQLAGAKDLIDTTCNMLSAVTNIPQTLLFGRSPAGQNSTGESDLESYYNNVERIQKLMLKNNLKKLLTVTTKAGIANRLLDEEPDYELEFSPLWSMSETEQASVEQTKAQTAQVKAQTAQVYVDMGAIDPSEIRKGLAESDEFIVEEILDDMSDGELDNFSQEVAANQQQPQETAQEEVVDETAPKESESGKKQTLRAANANRDGFDGGPGSGNHGHEGRPGKVGGSAPSSETSRPNVEKNNPQVISEKSSTGEIIRDGDKVYKNTTVVGLNPKPGDVGRRSLEGEVYESLQGSPNILPGRVVDYDGQEKIETPFVKNIVSTDHIPKEKRASVSNILNRELDGMTDAINDLSNAGYSYNDPLQFAYHDGKMKLFDFSNASKKDITKAVESNYGEYANFLESFGLEGAAKRISTGMELWSWARDTSDDDIAKGLHLMDDKTLESVKQLKATGVEPNNLYYSRNARTVQLRTRIGQTEIDDDGNKYIVSEKPLTQKDMDEWEIKPIYQTKSGNTDNFDSGYGNDSAVSGVGVLVIQDGKVLIGERDDADGWGGPGGHIEQEETPEQAATRETHEEFGITPTELIPLGTVTGLESRYGEPVLFLCTELTGTIRPDGKEIKNARLCSLDELSDLNLYPPFASSIVVLLNELNEISSEDGGPGSGNFGHKGRKGKVGGSAAGGHSGVAAGKDHTLKKYTQFQSKYDKLRTWEKKLTPLLTDVAKKVGADMSGLKFSVKTAKSIEEKIDTRMAEFGFSEEEAFESIHDIVRYTQLNTTETLVENALKTLQMLEEKGYKAVSISNTWWIKNIAYRGVNVKLKNSQGDRFELQFHTPESLDVKEKNHKLYEEARDPKTSKERRMVLNEQMVAYASVLVAPRSIERIVSYEESDDNG